MTVPDYWRELSVCQTCELAVAGVLEIHDAQDRCSARALREWGDFHLWVDCSGDDCEALHVLLCDCPGADGETQCDEGHHAGGFTWRACDLCGSTGRQNIRVYAEPRVRQPITCNDRPPGEEQAVPSGFYDPWGVRRIQDEPDDFIDYDIYPDDDDDDDDEDRCTCDSCRREYRESRESGGRVYDYSYKPSPLFHGDGPLFLGPEIEVEVGRRGDFGECVQLATEKLGSLGYLKRDGSLNNGFEIVTHPMAYDWAMANFPWDMLSELRSMGCVTEPSHTGLHVHVSRAGFKSACHAYRWMKFIYRNQRQVTALARRHSDEWAAFDPDSRAQVKHYVKGAQSYSRYQAINPNNEFTYELRMFASSLDPGEIKGAFGFASASVEYTRQLAYAQVAKEGGWEWGAFARWLEDRPAYAPLLDQMEVLECVS